MRLVICGGTGFIGRALTQALLSRGDHVWIITRSKPERRYFDPALLHPEYVTWSEWQADPDRIGSIDGIVNLAGESINQRWNAKAKQRIVTSRTEAAAKVSAIIKRMSNPPPVVVNASGLSDNHHDPSHGPYEDSVVIPSDFLGHTVLAWEAAADRIPVERLVKIRIGLVCTAKGGAFPLIRLPYRMFVGGRIGSGRQGMPWIHLQDMVALILFCIDTPDISGPVNACAPDPVSNDEFGRMLGKVTHRPHWFPVPGAMLRLILGEMSTLVIKGQQYMPNKALQHGYQFTFPNLQEALRDITR